MTFERVVCFVDGSSDGLEALRQGAVLREPNGALLGVVPCDLGLAAAAGFEAAHAARQLEDEAKAAREAAERELIGLERARIEVVSGRAATVLVDAVARHEADLLVLGMHRRSRRRGLVLGSLVTDLLHRAPCSVLVARARPAGPWSPQTVVVGFDGSLQSQEALAVARALASRLDAAVRAIGATGGKPVDADQLLELGDAVIDPARPVDALVAAGESADLLVVGSRGLHGLASLGSVSERVAHRARCSVLVVQGQGSGAGR